MVAVVAAVAPRLQQVDGDELADGAARLESGLVVEGPVDAAVDPAGAGLLGGLPEAVEGTRDRRATGRDLGRVLERDRVAAEEVRQHRRRRGADRAVRRRKIG